MKSNVSDNTSNLSGFIKEAFGSNATYVEGLLTRYKTDPNLVDASWQEYFGTLLSGGVPTGATANGQAATPAPQPKIETTPVVKAPPAIPISADTEPKAITGT